MIRLRNVALGLDEGEQRLWDKAEAALGTKVSALRVARKAVDARRKADVHFVYTLDVSVRDQASALARCTDAAPAPVNDYAPPVPARLPDERPVVVGFGPAGWSGCAGRAYWTGRAISSSARAARGPFPTASSPPA